MKIYKFAVLISAFMISCDYNTEINDEEIVEKFSSKENPGLNNRYDVDDRLQISIISYNRQLIKTFFYYQNFENEKNVSSIKTYINDKPFGNWFEFYENGLIKKYCFLLGYGSKSRFITSFNERGQITNQQGTPLIFFSSQFHKNSTISFYSVAIYDSLQVEYCMKNSKYKKLGLVKSKLQPLVLEGTIPLVKEEVVLRIKTYKNNKNTFFRDTIKL